MSPKRKSGVCERKIFCDFRENRFDGFLEGSFLFLRYTDLNISIRASFNSRSSLFCMYSFFMFSYFLLSLELTRCLEKRMIRNLEEGDFI
jgi:hypothetical protein